MRSLFAAALALCWFGIALGQDADTGAIAPNEEKIAAVADGTIQEALASWWGFSAEDATQSLQAALDSGVKTLRVDKQSAPWTVTPLNVPSDIEVVIDPGVTIQAKEGEFRPRGASLLSIDQQKNVVLRGGGDSVLLMRKSDYHKEPYEKSEWRHGITMTAVKNVRIENLTIRSTGGDGIYVGAGNDGAPCEDVTIRDVFCDDNNRQGASVISARNLLIEKCVLSNTRGTAPEAGIDFEPNYPSECLVNCVMRDCVLDNNQGCGIALWLGQLEGGVSEPISLRFERCVCRGNKLNGYFEGFFHHHDKVLQGDVTLRDCLFAGNGDHAVRLFSKSPDAHGFRLENVVIDMTGAGEDVSPFGFFSKTYLDEPPVRRPVGGMVWEDITVINPEGRPLIWYRDDTGNGFGLFDITGKVTMKKSPDDPGEVITIDQQWLTEHFPGVREPKEPEEKPAEE